jgi:hypothetical protein
VTRTRSGRRCPASPSSAPRPRQSRVELGKLSMWPPVTSSMNFTTRPAVTQEHGKCCARRDKARQLWRERLSGDGLSCGKTGKVRVRCGVRRLLTMGGAWPSRASGKTSPAQRCWSAIRTRPNRAFSIAGFWDSEAFAFRRQPISPRGWRPGLLSRPVDSYSEPTQLAP